MSSLRGYFHIPLIFCLLPCPQHVQILHMLNARIIHRQRKYFSDVWSQRFCLHQKAVQSLSASAIHRYPERELLFLLHGNLL